MYETEFVKTNIIVSDPVVKIFNINNIALFTTDPLIKGVNEFEVCNSLRSVAEFFGTNTNTYKMANAMFSQVRKFTDGDGSLYIIPFAGVSATSSTITTGDLTGNIASFKAVADGKIKFTIDGIVHDINGLKFTNITGVKDIAKIIQAKVSESVLKIEVVENNTKIKFSSLKLGLNSTLTIDVSSLTGTDLIDETRFNDSDFIETEGENASGETLKQACERILALPQGVQPNFESLITTLRFELDFEENSYLVNLATYLAGRNKIFTYTYSSINDNANALLVKQAGFKQTRLIAHKSSEALEMTGAIVSFLFSNKLSIPSNSLTLNDKSYVGVTPALYWTEGEKQAFRNAGVDYYINDIGTPAYRSSVANGGAFDEIYNIKLIGLEITQATANALRVPTKLGQTQASIEYVAINVITPVLVRCRDNRIIPLNGGAKWNGQIPDGVSADTFQSKIQTEGFYLLIPSITNQSQADREERKMPPILIYVKLEGAVHELSVLGYIER